jgi:hypothetical protein
MSRLLFVPAVVLFLLCPAFTQTQAVLRPNGPVKINGRIANGSTVVMEGDRIDTDQHSSAFLFLPGRMITVGARSSVEFKNASVVPSAGAVKIADTTCHGFSCTTSSTLLGSGEVKQACTDSEKGKDDKDCHPKKKCISPKKPHKDKDCDEDEGDDDHGHD